MDIAILVIIVAQQILYYAIIAYIALIVIRAITSWFRPDPANKLVRFLNGVTEPVLEPVRSFIMERLGLYMGGIDISPLIVVLALGALNRLIAWGASALIRYLTSAYG